MENKKNILVSRRSYFELYFVRYVAFVGLITAVTLVEIIWLSRHEPQNIGIIVSLVIVFAVLQCLIIAISNNFIFRITVDYDMRRFRFDMFKKSKSYEIGFDELEKICVNFYITFHFRGERVLYRGDDDKELIRFISGHEKVIWGFASRWLYRNE